MTANPRTSAGILVGVVIVMGKGLVVMAHVIVIEMLVVDIY